MAKLPEPPNDLQARALPLETIPSGQLLHRLHLTAKGGKFFGRSGKWRFDSPDGSYGTLYGATSEPVCFVETLLRGEDSFVAQSELDIRSFCRFRVIRELRLVSLYGPHMAAISASAAITSSPDYDVSKRWSHEFHSHKDNLDGIIYRANYDNDGMSVVLFERARGSIDDGSSAPVMSDPTLLGNILNRYKASIR